jgi:DNA-binding MarR family transcriptional regulator
MPAPAKPSSQPFLEDDLGWSLGVLFRAYVKTSAAATADLPGGHRGYQVLASACRGLPGSQSALAQQLGIDRTVMTYLLDDLERAGLVERRPDPTDRRNRQILPTDAGHELLDTLERRLGAIETHVLAGLSESERETLKSLLGQVAGHVNAADPVGSTCEVVEDLKG